MTDWSSRFDDNFWDDGGDDVDNPTPPYEGNHDHALKRAYVVGGVGREIVGIVPGEFGRGGGGGGTLHSKSHGCTHANAPSQPQSSFRCPNCNSSNIEALGPSGSSVCTDCGIIVEENTIVSTVEFVEGAGGSSSMVGQFVGANSSSWRRLPSGKIRKMNSLRRREEGDISKQVVRARGRMDGTRTS
ncbi:hypothetical protein ACHAXA_008685 [Cyclostephanos tholiformis]|uniref:TFIIB-type domain-containing protein n=1 Tax=Cyclostephanos tholiformis TaxID=382380 RepID=A0ABD3RX69_9STRA